MHRIVNDEAMDVLFRKARDHSAWLHRSVSDTLLRALGELVKNGSTSGSAPARIVFVKSIEARDRLVRVIAAEWRDRVEAAPVTAILAHLRNHGAAPGVHDGGIQAAYLMLAARALGLDCGPVWEFDDRAVNAAFFEDGRVGASFICGLGYGDETQASVPLRRGFNEACEIL